MHKRRYGRVKAQGVASHLRAGGAFAPGITVENLSRGGAFVRTAETMPVGTVVVVDLVKPGLKKALRLSGRVVSVVEPKEVKSRGHVAGMGIAFDPYSADIQERLEALLMGLAPGEALLEGDEQEIRPPPPPIPPSGAGVKRTISLFDRQWSGVGEVDLEQPPGPPPEPAPQAPPAKELPPAAREPLPAPLITPQDSEPVAVPQGARLMVQVKGLLMELGEWQAKSAALEKENEELKLEVARLKREMTWLKGR